MTIRIPLTRARAAAAVSVAAIALTTALPATPASALGGLQIPKASPFVNSNSGKCLEIADWSTANGAPARQWDCTGGTNQLFDMIQAPGKAAYFLRNRNSGKCLEIADWSTEDGAPARQWDCTGGDNQAWELGSAGEVQTGPKEVGLINWNSMSYLEVADYRLDNGAPVRQWRGGLGWNKYWTIVNAKAL
ncbi:MULTISPECIES: RICIN domain-containing protein [unclassified Kitasatospora]|uniref:RICIN domain-containing protein n=1 Tax=unclassified Kitasatospora TaxID=2633591 RepID=UPI00340134AD